MAVHAPPLFDRYADRFTRQVAYHGLHEIGQTFVDFGWQDMGCTLFAVPFGQSWLIGRNFDFVAGRVFDEDKIVKWVYPTRGIPYVSVIWGGMVGGVTGINEKGIYLSINAGGSADFARYGTPSTLVLTKVLQFASTAEEAIKIIQDSQMFITDILVLVDAKSGTAYRIEKSPRRAPIFRLTGPTVVTNHLLDPIWQNDKINEFRKANLTSIAREARGKSYSRPGTPKDPIPRPKC